MALLGIWHETDALRPWAFPAAWAIISAASLAAMLGSLPIRPVRITIAAAAGLVTGLLTTGWPMLVVLVALPMTGMLARFAVARDWPLAVKVVAGWLLATAMLNATLTVLPVTPGYVPDHLE